MTMLKKILVLLALGGILAACQSKDKHKLTIAVAANMQFAMEPLIQTFTHETGITCEMAISSSGKLTAQIEEGAPFDLFISADMKYPTRLFEKGLSTAAPEVYAYGKLVLWSMMEDLEPSFELLSEEKIHHIALANPKTAPYGVAATQVLKHFKLLDALQHKLVYGESISQTNQFIVSKAAELGFTAKSVVLSPRMNGNGQWLDIDMSLYSPIAQGVVMLRHTDQDKVIIQQFYNFLFSEKAKEILVRFGYQIDGI